MIYDHKTGQIEKRMTADEVEEYTNGAVRKVHQYRTKLAVSPPAVPPDQRYAPQGFAFKVEEDRHRRGEKILTIKHESEREEKRFPGRFPKRFYDVRPHPTNPQVVLVRAEGTSYLLLIDAEQAEKEIQQQRKEQQAR